MIKYIKIPASLYKCLLSLSVMVDITGSNAERSQGVSESELDCFIYVSRVQQNIRIMLMYKWTSNNTSNACHHFFFGSFNPAPALNLKKIMSPSSTT